MTDCIICRKKIEKGSDFILSGKMPGLLKRYFNFDFYGMEYYGDCCHKECFLRTK